MSATRFTPTSAAPDLSVVIPVHDESGNIAPLLEEIDAALADRFAFEVICVDDASDDGSLAILRALTGRHPHLRVLAHPRQGGQSLAIRNGVKAARAPWIVTLDGDGQNDPADVPALVAARDAADARTKLVGGWRIARRDTWSKRIGSRLANAVRRRLLRDQTPDTGCGTKLFEREAFLDLPYFDHMHRYLPALMQRAGWRTACVPVNHRERGSGRSNYTNLGRLGVGLFDLCGVAWLMRRSRVIDVADVAGVADVAESGTESTT